MHRSVGQARPRPTLCKSTKTLGKAPVAAVDRCRVRMLTLFVLFHAMFLFPVRAVSMYFILKLLLYTKKSQFWTPYRLPGERSLREARYARCVRHGRP